jgi:hypothetical protein
MTASRTLRLACTLLLLSAGSSAARANVEDRINAAIPLSGSAQTALLQMRRLVSAPPLRARIEAQLHVKMRLRALECGQDFAISPGSSDEQIRRQYGGNPCLAAQDAVIAEWLGLRTVGALLGLPPLRPVPPGTPARLADLEAPIQRVSFAAQAGVAVMSSYKDIEVVDTAAGVPISTSLGPQQELLQSISPNGRVYTTGHQGQLRFYDSEDGTLVASPQWCMYGGDCRFQWLDNRTVLIDAGGSRGPELYDFQTGASGPLDGRLEPIERIAPLDGTASTYIAFRDSGLTTFRLDYVNGQPHADVIQTVPIRLNLIPMSGGAVPGGHYYVNTSSGQLYVSDLSDLHTEAIDLGDFFVQRVLPEADPDRLLFAGFLRGGPPTWRFYEYALREQTVSALDTSQLPSTQFVFDPAQGALFVLAGEALTRVDALPRASQAARAAFAASMRGTQPTMPRQSPYLLVPGTGGITTSGGMMRSIIPPAPPAVTPPVIAGPVARLAKSADVQGIGIFGAELPSTPGSAQSDGYVGTISGTEVQIYRSAGRTVVSRGSPGVAGIVRVVIRPRPQSLILVLSSFSSIQWRLRLAPGARLAAVLITGPHGSSVAGEGNIPVVAIGSAYSYVVGSPGYMALQNEVYAWTGKRMSLLQCGFRGKDFLVY